MTPAELREECPAFEELVYLNTGASGPSPRRVVDAATSFLEYHEYDASGTEGMYPAAFDTIDEVRSSVADFLGANSDEIALTQSTTDGINRVASALDWESGDVVVRTDLEHPAGVLPWQRLQRHREIEVRVVETERGRIDLEVYRRAVSDAKLVCFSALSWNYGTTLPVKTLTQIAHEEGAFVLVDAVQSPGQTPVDVTEWGADAVAGAGHKWLLGVWGAGFLYVDEEAAERLRPSSIGYQSVTEPMAAEYELQGGARRFEVGTTNPAPHVALETAIETISEIGVGAIERRIASLAGRLVDGVPADRLLSPAEPESGLVTIDVDDPERTVERLAGDGIVLRDIPGTDAVRASVHAVNTESDIDVLLEALEPEW